MKLYSLQMEIKLQLYEITFSHLQQRTQKFESQRNPLTQSINKETPLQCNLRASYRSACFCLKNRIQIAQRTQTVDSSEWVTIFQAVTQDIIKSRKQAPVRKKKKRKTTSSISPFSSEERSILLQSDPETHLLNYHVGFLFHLIISPWLGKGSGSTPWQGTKL